MLTQGHPRWSAQALSLGLALVLSACGDRATTPAVDAAAAADQRADAAAPTPDAGGRLDQEAPRDLWSPADAPCTCKPGEVYLRGHCVPTSQLYTCAPSCVSGVCGGQPGQFFCHGCAATTSCKIHVCQPACVPAIKAVAFLPGTLRITPTSGLAGQPVTIAVDGGDPYIGPLEWKLQVGGQPGPPIKPAGGCIFSFSFTPPAPGVYAVELGYGGKPWSLAGFYAASGGGAAPQWIQPGYRCAKGDSCAEAPPYSCDCVSGRCACK